MNETIKTVMENLKKNRMEAYFVSTKVEVVPLVKSLLKSGETVAVGGSVSLDETGVMDLLRCGDYAFLDRYDPTLTPEERTDIFRRSAFVDSYLCSSNAVTLQGELYNVDGNSNRISAIAFGPRQVILVVGVNKIVDDIPAAARRVKTIAAPLNTKRLGCDTYCYTTGHCMAVDGEMTEGCHSPGRICCGYLISGPQRIPDRIKVILVGESCGY